MPARDNQPVGKTAAIDSNLYYRFVFDQRHTVTAAPIEVLLIPMKLAGSSITLM
ncbi:MAG: hypothetical protein WCI02_09945 [Planctomycetota bacterium]